MKIKEATSGTVIQTLESLLNGINGIERVLVNVEDGEVKFEYRSAIVTFEQIVELFENNGLHIRK
ncbi:hypothetical protein [Peribacillus saganii]|uniref:hypothetical protein n=1 Tax=Peribacillus saganii TaxID=2303992 RepID=UPI00115D13F6|nr:hypothetical protein [Peribacillus saganii]